MRPALGRRFQTAAKCIQFLQRGIYVVEFPFILFLPELLSFFKVDLLIF